ncbi:hypothetical protein FGG08_000775 [Glutinoglossum americanum]|uniref:Endoplasmic reticulum-Golgi intermediate compartment protein n=1 Tax=Glutinoglossum americanum TaxID=1670608 RepID=A0A9P8ICU1_9PEZI|nr:hypothetical protein FGG08_000775 [Glutinoglossum americanum]
MNGFASADLDEDAFGEKKGLQGLKTFDAFPKTKTSYTTRHARGGQWTVVLIIISLLLTVSEFVRWHRRYETHQFSVEKGIGHELQINLDIVVAMPCSDLHVNVQDASGDRILAGGVLKHDPTNWSQWGKGMHQLGWGDQNAMYDDEIDHLADIIGGRESKWRSTPRLKGDGNACRIYGDMQLNKVQGDFHITARGHGYMEWGQHLSHDVFNFSHIIPSLSFGPHYESLHNPLSNTIATTNDRFYRYQYYLSLVPTVYAVTGSTSLEDPPHLNAVQTNQYAVTSQSHTVPENSVPGIFFKFDIEPILLTVVAQRSSFLALLVRIVNVVSGVLVAGGWLYQMMGWGGELLGKKRGGRSEGMLNGRVYVEDADGDE